MKDKIGIGCDHAGFELKEKVKLLLTKKGFEIKDFGTNSQESVDYPDYIHPLAKEVNNGLLRRAIIICGSGNGVSMVANKYPAVRAALSWTEELAELGRLHNDANVLALPARFIDAENALKIVDVFLNTEFEGGRHSRRVNKIKDNIDF